MSGFSDPTNQSACVVSQERLISFMSMQRVIAWVLILIGLVLILMAWIMVGMTIPNSVAFTILGIVIVLLAIAGIVSTGSAQLKHITIANSNSYIEPPAVVAPPAFTSSGDLVREGGHRVSGARLRR